MSWSGDRSQKLAHALRDWLPLVLENCEPWLSEVDVTAGDRWAVAVASELSASNFGIICVTPENMTEPWLLFEAGALAKSIPGGRVIPLVLDLEFGDLTGPLAQFQAKKVTQQGVGEIVHAINNVCDSPRPPERARHVADSLWPELEKSIASIPTKPATLKPKRPQDEIIEELVTGVRGLDSRFRDLERVVGEDPRPRRRPRMPPPMMMEEMAMMVTEDPGDPMVILLLAGLVREDLPWLAEVMVDVYREVRGGDEKSARRALTRLHRLIRNMRRGPLMELTMGSGRDGEWMVMELPRMLDHVLHRYEGRERSDDAADATDGQE